MRFIPESELILNPDGSVCNLNLLPQDIAETIILVADRNSVDQVSAFFDTVELKKDKGEYITHTGFVGQQRVSVLSTGKGTHNVDIVLNELDALVNIDFALREEKKDKVKLKLIRVGTSASIQEDVAVNSLLLTEYAVGLDSLMQYYAQSLSLEEEHFKRSVENHFDGLFSINPYVAAADADLLSNFGSSIKKGITLTTPGFYAPQGKMLRARGSIDNLIKGFQNFSYNHKRLSNLDMETSGLYALAKNMGHAAISINAITSNRINGTSEFHPEGVLNEALTMVFEKLF